MVLILSPTRMEEASTMPEATRMVEEPLEWARRLTRSHDG
jgi:hypothetical protein